MIERVAGLLERALAPGTTVHHDVNLPDLTNPPHERQCDVVVTSGIPPRTTRTIVEVQRRGKKVEVGHFDGWVTKMRDVGAQHLVCVSATGFPASIIAKAARLGPTVRLLTLKEITRDSPLLAGLFSRPFRMIVYDTERIFNLQLKEVPPQAYVDFNERLFRTAVGEVVSLSEIAMTLYIPAINAEPEGEHRLNDLEPAEEFVFLPFPQAGPTRIRFSVVATKRTFPLVLDAFEYRQIDDPAAQAWAVVATGQRDATTEYAVQVTFRPDSTGRLVPSSVHLEGMKKPGFAIISQSLLNPGRT